MTARAVALQRGESRYAYTLQMVHAFWRLARAASCALRRVPGGEATKSGGASQSHEDASEPCGAGRWGLKLDSKVAEEEGPDALDCATPSTAAGSLEPRVPESDAGSTDDASSVADDDLGCVDSRTSDGSLGSLGDGLDAFEDDDAAADDAFSDTSTEATCSGPSEQVLAAHTLQRELFAVLSAPGFQAQLLLLLRDHGGPDAAQLLTGREELCMSALGEVLPRHGFDASAEGLDDAFQEMIALSIESDDLLDGVEALYDCLGCVPPWQEADAGALGAGGGHVPWSL